jgi:uncharacterized protein (DUF433 family)
LTSEHRLGTITPGGEPSRPIIAVGGDEGIVVDVGRRPGHHIVTDRDLDLVADQLSRGGWATRKEQLRHIEVNPNRLSGEPVIKGTRIAASHVAELAATDDGRRELREDYEIDEDAIEDAVRWWRVVQEFEEAA